MVNSNNASRTTAANIISESLANAGIKIKINAVPEAQYYSLLRSKSYDLYLGEIRYEDNMDIQGLISINSASALLPNNNSSSEKPKTTTSAKKSSSSKVSSTGSLQESSSEQEILNPGEITLTSADAYKGFYSGEYTLQDLITAFNAELPVIPICFKNGMVIYSDRFGNGITSSRTELFHGIQFLN